MEILSPHLNSMQAEVNLFSKAGRKNYELTIQYIPFTMSKQLDAQEVPTMTKRNLQTSNEFMIHSAFIYPNSDMMPQFQLGGNSD